MSYTRVGRVCAAVLFVVLTACLCSERRLGRRVQDDPVDRSTIVPTGQLEVVPRIDDPRPSGVAVSKTGRLFLGFPRHAVCRTPPIIAFCTRHRAN